MTQVNHPKSNKNVRGVECRVVFDAASDPAVPTLCIFMMCFDECLNPFDYLYAKNDSPVLMV